MPPPISMVFISRGNTKFLYGYSDGFFSRLAFAEPKRGTHGGFDINTISGITSGFKSRGYESTLLVLINY
jgi:hypothetical protein